MKPEGLRAGKPRGGRRLVLSVVYLMGDNLSTRRRFRRAAQVPEYRLELIGNAAKLAEKL